MKARTFDPSSLKISLFQAPPVSEVKPYRIPRGSEVIELVTGGVIHFRVGESDLRLGCGALFWHVAGDETIHRTEESDPYGCLAMRFLVSSRLRRDMPRVSVIADRQRAVELIQEILSAYHDESIDREILGEYVRSRLRWEAHQGTVQRPGMDTPPAIRSVVTLVEEHFQEPGLSIARLAGMVGLSEPHLHTLFRKHLGQPPHQYVITRRVREAKIMLTQEPLTIKAIAAECGFENIETFYRAFKRIVGTTPYQYRRTHALPVLADE